MNNISIANETIAITAAGQYQCGGNTVKLTSPDPSAVRLITPDMGRQLLEQDTGSFTVYAENHYSVTTEDSFSAAARLGGRVLVLNFANAHSPGGGFRLGANAQEEALCRCSTLYASITSDAAREMYRYNNSHISKVESDYMLISDDVCVFRDNNLELLEQPFNVGVITAPAPNRRGAAVFASKNTINETFLRRIRIILRAAASDSYSSIVLGAWGCGAFGNSPESVAAQFRIALVDDGMERFFSNICFPVLGMETSEKYTAFRKCFADRI